MVVVAVPCVADSYGNVVAEYCARGAHGGDFVVDLFCGICDVGDERLVGCAISQSVVAVVFRVGGVRVWMVRGAVYLGSRGSESGLFPDV